MHKKRCPDCMMGYVTSRASGGGCSGNDCQTCNGTGWIRKTKKDRLKAMQQTLNPQEKPNA